MPRTRAVDPFGSRRVRRPARAVPAPDPNEEHIAPGELARRVAAAMSARYGEVAEMTGAEVRERILAAIDEESPALDAEESPGELDGDDGAESPGEAHTDAQGAAGDALEAWPDAKAAAAALGVDPAEVRRRCREGELDAAKDAGGAWRINPAALASS